MPAAIEPRLCRGRDLRSSEMLCTIRRFFVTDVSEERISPILNGQVVQWMGPIGCPERPEDYLLDP